MSRTLVGVMGLLALIGCGGSDEDAPSPTTTGRELVFAATTEMSPHRVMARRRRKPMPSGHRRTVRPGAAAGGALPTVNDTDCPGTRPGSRNFRRKSPGARSSGKASHLAVGCPVWRDISKASNICLAIE